MKRKDFNILIFVLSFIIVGFIDNFINERTFQTFTSKELQTFPISLYFAFFEIASIAAGFLIVYKLRKRIVDLLLLPIWLAGFDMFSLIFNRKSIFEQENWRKEIWGEQLGFFGESFLGLPMGYWISVAFLVVYLLVAYKPQIINKLKARK